jgi:hypothetical protein
MLRGTRDGTGSLRRGAIGLAVGALAVSAVAAPSGAQTEDPEPPAPVIADGNRFTLAGVRNPQTLEAVAVDVELSGSLAYCTNPNGLGAELYLQGTGAQTTSDGTSASVSVRHASVTPFVIPLHLGLLEVDSSDPDNPMAGASMTIGVARGTSVEFGESGAAVAEFGGIFFGPSGVGAVNWRHRADIACEDSVVMPILNAAMNADRR